MAVGLSIMILINTVSDMLPNPPKPEYSPLINDVYQVALGAMSLQLIVIIITSRLESLSSPPPFANVKIDFRTANYNKESNFPAVKELVGALHEIRDILRVSLDDDQTRQKNVNNKWWRAFASRLNLVFFSASLLVELIMIGQYTRDVHQNSEPVDLAWNK